MILIIVGILFLPAAIYFSILTIRSIFEKQWVELLIFGSIAFLLIGIIKFFVGALPNILETDKKIKCITNLANLYNGIVLYSQDYKGKFPDSLSKLYPKYVSSPKYFFCPGTKGAKNIKTITEENSLLSYEYIKGLNKNSPSDCVVLFDKEENHHREGRTVVFVNGRLLWISKDNWPKIYQKHLDLFFQDSQGGKHTESRKGIKATK